MAKLYIAEFFLGADKDIAFQPPLVEQTVAISATHTESAAFSSETKIIRVHPDSTCSIAIGFSPVASIDTARMAAGQTEYFEVLPAHKISVVSNT